MKQLPGLLVALVLAASGALAGPGRVVSMNLCTDQLAMMLAAPGQLVSVSHVATDRRMSPMADVAGAYPANHGQAEEVYLMKPDVVLVSAYSGAATTGMLTRLGIRVEVFQPANTLADVRDRIVQMGEVLGRQEAAAALLADYDTRLAALQVTGEDRPRAALYGANGFTSGPLTLAGQIVQTAGFDNVAGELGFDFFGALPLELLALSDPDMLITSSPYPRAGRAEEIVKHPVVRDLATRTGTSGMRDADWACGTPYVLNAIEGLAAERAALIEAGG
ncbi:MAG: cobalamin ABC transporter substrate-binding protein [Rhodobacteraceae bacterium]|nr:cobalamin ABC transporter substrate-binding protein [Paracoccaceae bacterium]